MVGNSVYISLNALTLIRMKMAGMTFQSESQLG
jgi:hypothetical protein